MKLTWSGFSINSQVFIGEHGVCRYETVGQYDKTFRVVIDYDSLSIGDEQIISKAQTMIIPIKVADRYIDKLRRSVSNGEEFDQSPFERFIREFVKQLNVDVPLIHIIVCRSPDVVMLELIVDPAKIDDVK